MNTDYKIRGTWRLQQSVLWKRKICRKIALATIPSCSPQYFVSVSWLFYMIYKDCVWPSIHEDRKLRMPIHHWRVKVHIVRNWEFKKAGKISNEKTLIFQVYVLFEIVLNNLLFKVFWFVSYVSGLIQFTTRALVSLHKEENCCIRFATD